MCKIVLWMKHIISRNNNNTKIASGDFFCFVLRLMCFFRHDIFYLLLSKNTRQLFEFWLFITDGYCNFNIQLNIVRTNFW